MKLDPKKTAVLSMDLQGGILDLHPAASGALPAAVKAVEFARRKNYQLIHIAVGFTPGYPEISTRHPRFSTLKQTGRMLIGTPSSDPHPSLFQKGDLEVHRVLTEKIFATQATVQNVDDFIREQES